MDKRLPGSVMISRKRKAMVETGAQAVFAFCALIAVFAVGFITLYIVISGVPAILEVGWKEILLGTVWRPTAEDARFGLLYCVFTSLAGTFLAMAAGLPVGILTAVFLAEMADRRVAGIIRTIVELLAGVPSVIYGLLGIYLLTPLMYRLERRIFADSPTHQYTGGANLLSASLVLAIMILPTVINISESAIRSVDPGIRAASLALGASPVQTVFRSVLPAARPGIAAAAMLGTGRAFGEAMAVTLVAGNSVNIPLPFQSVRFLTAAIVSEMGYSHGTHRKVLFTAGLVLSVLTMAVNVILTGILKEGAKRDD